jgi:hypothetical protein
MFTRYAASTGCFYPFDFDYKSLPTDIILVPQEDYDAAMARNPDDTLSVTDGRVVVVPKAPATLDELRAVAWSAIKAKRDNTKAGGVKIAVGTDEKWFHSDDASRIQYIGLVMLGDNIPQGLQWKTMDKTFVSMTKQIANGIFAKISVNDTEIFANAEFHRIAMEASQNPSDYDFSTGWPEIFVE